MKRVYLLTGPPGVGKTTIIKQVVKEFYGKAGGFFTEEIREQGERQGFRLVTLDNRDIILSHINFKSAYRIGKYGVNVEGLEKVGVTVLLDAIHDCDLVVVDEIGRMEMLSLKFRETIEQLIGNKKMVLGTILLHHHTWADIIKARPEVQVIMLNRDNRQQVLTLVKEWLKGTA